MIELHADDTPNGRKMSVALEEMGLSCRVHVIDITKGEQHDPALLTISPNNRIPAIVDTDGPGGAPISLFESDAILLCLAERTGRFLPTGLRERMPVLEWLMWQTGGFGPMLGQAHRFLGLQDLADQRYGLERYLAETRRLCGVLDRRLAAVEFMGEAFRWRILRCWAGRGGMSGTGLTWRSSHGCTHGTRR